MPIFIVKCLKCGEKQEYMSLGRNKFCCKKCGKNKYEIIPSVSNFVIKGFSSKNNYSKE